MISLVSDGEQRFHAQLTERPEVATLVDGLLRKIHWVHCVRAREGTMMWRLAIFVGVMVSGAAQAAECTISTARYKNDNLAWFLSFKPVPQFSAANQTAAFIIELPNSAVTLEGAVHRPNGFGSPLWSISGPCKPDSLESCTFVEGEGTAIYGTYAAKVGWLDDTRGAAAPEQVILPRLAESLWYSAYRGDEFGTEGTSSDVFSLTGCD